MMNAQGPGAPEIEPVTRGGLNAWFFKLSQNLDHLRPIFLGSRFGRFTAISDMNNEQDDGTNAQKPINSVR